MRDLNIAIDEEQARKVRTKFDTLSREDQEEYREAFSQEIFEELKAKLPSKVRREIDKLISEEEDKQSPPENEARMRSEMQQNVQSALVEYERDKPPEDFIKLPRFKKSFWDMGEDEEEGIGPEEDNYKGDDLNEQGHEELEYHRELRHYARVAVWEMPLLSSMWRPSYSSIMPLKTSVDVPLINPKFNLLIYHLRRRYRTSETLRTTRRHRNASF